MDNEDQESILYVRIPSLWWEGDLQVNKRRMTQFFSSNSEIIQPKTTLPKVEAKAEQEVDSRLRGNSPPCCTSISLHQKKQITKQEKAQAPLTAGNI